MISALIESVKPRLKLASSFEDPKILESFQSILSNGLKNGGAKKGVKFK
jgi:hypothetical protein